MIIVHEIFVAKPGNASRLAKMFKEATKESPEVKHILTDVTGAYNRVIMVSEYENLAGYEQSWEKMKAQPEAMKKMEEAMKGYQDMYLTGSREIFQVW
jgi:NIPSNAP